MVAVVDETCSRVEQLVHVDIVRGEASGELPGMSGQLGSDGEDLVAKALGSGGPKPLVEGDTLEDCEEVVR